MSKFFNPKILRVAARASTDLAMRTIVDLATMFSVWRGVSLENADPEEVRNDLQRAGISEGDIDQTMSDLESIRRD